MGEKTTHPPSTTDDNQPWLLTDLPILLVIFIVYQHPDHRQIVRASLLRVEREWIDRHTVDMSIGVRECVVQEYACADSDDTERRREKEIT